MKTLELADGKKIVVPDQIDIPSIKNFDEMGYELWDVIRKYLTLFGIQVEEGENPDWATVKEVQNKIVQVLQEAGVNFQTDIPKRRVIVNSEFSVVLDDRDIEIIMQKALDGGIVHWCSSLGSSGKAPKEPHKELTHGGILTFYDRRSEDDEELDKDRFIVGFKQYLKDPVGNDVLKFVDHKMVVDIEKVDSQVADAIVQYAIYGEVRYKMGVWKHV